MPWFLRSPRYPDFKEWIVAWTGVNACDWKNKSVNGLKILIAVPGEGPVLETSLQSPEVE